MIAKLQLSLIFDRVVCLLRISGRVLFFRIFYYDLVIQQSNLV